MDPITLQSKVRTLSAITGVLVIALTFSVGQNLRDEGSTRATLTQMKKSSDQYEACYKTWHTCFEDAKSQAKCFEDFRSCVEDGSKTGR